MENNKKHNYQLTINDLIDDAITDAVTRRELVALSDEEAARVGGGLTIEGDTKVAVNEPVEAWKPIDPYCPPTQLPTQPICPPIIVGLIALPDQGNLLRS